MIEPEGKKVPFATPFCVGAVGVATTGSGELDEAVAKVGLRYIEMKLLPESADVQPVPETVYNKTEKR